jgi:hypothetical protein
MKSKYIYKRTRFKNQDSLDRNISETIINLGYGAMCIIYIGDNYKINNEYMELDEEFIEKRMEELAYGSEIDKKELLGVAILGDYDFYINFDFCGIVVDGTCLQGKYGRLSVAEFIIKGIIE